MRISIILLTLFAILEKSKSARNVLRVDSQTIITSKDKYDEEDVNNQDVSSLIIENRTDEIITVQKLQKFPNLETLSIRSSEILKIESGSLCQSKNLTTLKFIYNTKIPKFTHQETFKGCYGLRELYIDGAALIQNEAFSELSQLKTLRINDSILPEVLTEKFLLGVGKSLRNLEIKHSNLRNISNNSLDALENLKFLSLGYNHLKLVPRGLFKRLVGLKSLDLSGNELEQLDFDTFADLKSLQILFLDSNRFREFDFGLIRVLPRLERVFYDRKHMSDDQLMETSLQVAKSNVTLIWTGSQQ